MTLTTRIGRLTSTSAAASCAVAVLAAAFRDGAVARWLEPRADTRHLLVEGYFAGIVHRVQALGQVVVAAREDWHPGRRLDGVALWARHPLADTDPGEADLDPGNPDLDLGEADLPLPPAVAQRLAVLREALDARRPAEAHVYLAYLAVHPQRQCRGIGSALLATRHAVLDALGQPAYLEADDARNRDLYLRHGYLASDPVHLPHGGPTLWPMWRPPRPAGRRPSGPTPTRQDPADQVTADQVTADQVAAGRGRYPVAHRGPAQP